jgi:hypothetical protein
VEAVDLWNEERRSLLLLRDTVLEDESTTSPYMSGVESTTNPYNHRRVV